MVDQIINAKLAGKLAESSSKRRNLRQALAAAAV